MPEPEKSCRVRLVRALVAASCLLAVSGCATPGKRVASDPIEPFNRAVHGFNQTVDKYAAKPIARTYDFIVPDLVKTGVRNFFNNIDDVFVVVNDLLQLKGTLAARDSVRLVSNTVFGVVGVIDVAGMRGITKRSEDFGQTLGWWGVPAGPYLELPLLGPSSFRDGPARFVDAVYDPVWRFGEVPVRNSLIALRAVDTRASLLPAEKLLDVATADRYAFLRDGYLARRQRLVDDEDTDRPRRRGGAIAKDRVDEDPGDGAADDALAPVTPPTRR